MGTTWYNSIKITEDIMSISAKELTAFQKRIEEANRKWLKDNKVEEKIERIRWGSSLEDPRLISTGNPALDWALGGGIQEGTIFELYGAPGAGKTTAMCYIMAEVQKLGKYVIYYHLEEAAKPSKAWKLAGVDENKVVYINALKSGEDGLNLIRELLVDDKGIPTDVVGMIVMDSISALAPAAEVTSVDGNGMEGTTMARQAALTSKMFRIMTGTGWLSKGCLTGLVNQERAQIGQTPLPNLTSGGKSIPYYAKVRVQLKQPSDKFLVENEGVVTEGKQDSTGKKLTIGHTIDYYISKNNTGSAPPFRRGSWRVIYEKGIDYLGPIIEEAITYGIIEQIGRSRFIVKWISENTIKKSDSIHGRAALIKYIESNSPEVQNGIQDAISKVRAYTSETSVDFVDGLAYINGTEADILELIIQSVKENIITEVEDELIPDMRGDSEQ